MVKYLCIIQARVSSSRLPSKVMLDLSGKTLLQRVIESVKLSKYITKVVVSTSSLKADDIIVEKLNQLGIESYRGSIDNVLERFFFTAKEFNAKNIVRVTGDNPLTEASLIDNLIERFENSNCEYCGDNGSSIVGINSEVFSFKALKKAYISAKTDFEKEHVTPYIKNNLDVLYVNPLKRYQNNKISVTVDTLDDYITVAKFYLYCNDKKLTPSIDEYLKFINENSNFN